MTDPVYEKLKADAGIVLGEMWRTLWRPADQGDLQEVRIRPSSDVAAERAENRARPSGLCYFHLN